MQKFSFKQFLCQALCALSFLGLAAQASAQTQFNVVIDTTSIAGGGWLDLQFNPGQENAPAATAMLSNFQGLTSSVDAQVSGAVTGLLGGNVQFGNSAAFNNLFQSVQLGQRISFNVSFSGAFLTAPSDIGTSFSLSLFAADQATLLGNGNPDSGSLLTFELFSPLSSGQFGSVTPVVFDGGLVSVSAVPEPSEWLMMVAGLAALGVVAQRRRKQVAQANVLLAA